MKRRYRLMNPTSFLIATTAAGLLAGSASLSQAAVLFSDTFETLYTPGLIHSSGSTANTFLNPAAYASYGNSSWGKVIESGTNNHVYQASVGTSTGQSAIIATKSAAYGLAANPGGTQFSLDIAGVNWGTNPTGTSGIVNFVIYGQNSGGTQSTSFWSATNAIALRITNNWIGLVVKDNANGDSHNASRTLWSANYNGTINHIDIILTTTGYELVVGGSFGSWNVAGSLSGTHDLSNIAAFNTASFGIELLQTPSGGTARNPFSIDIDNITIQSIPEVATLSLIGAPTLLLLRRR